MPLWLPVAMHMLHAWVVANDLKVHGIVLRRGDHLTRRVDCCQGVIGLDMVCGQADV